jgi:hypothetical protein
MTSVLVLVFALAAADPTPRFLGLPRAPRRVSLHELPLGGARIKAVLPCFNLPRSLCSRTISPLKTAELVGVIAPRASTATRGAGALASAALAPNLSRDSIPDRNGSGPPLRC